MRTYVYRNLTERNWTLQERGLKVAGADRVRLGACEFRVRPGGRQRVLRERRKNVHAFVIGEVLEAGGKGLAPAAEPVEVTYNPYASGAFTTPEGAAVLAAAVVELTPEGKVRAWGLTLA